MKKGFTLIEVMIVMMILGLCIATISPIVFQVIKLNTKLVNRYKVIKVAQNCMEEIKSLELIIGDNRNYSLEELIVEEVDIVKDEHNINVKIFKLNEVSSIYKVDLKVTSENHKAMFNLSTYIDRTDEHKFKSCYDEI